MAKKQVRWWIKIVLGRTDTVTPEEPVMSIQVPFASESGECELDFIDPNYQILSKEVVFTEENMD